jgi:hypothetical protein
MVKQINRLFRSLEKQGLLHARLFIRGKEYQFLKPGGAKNPLEKESPLRSSSKKRKFPMKKKEKEPGCFFESYWL